MVSSIDIEDLIEKIVDSSPEKKELDNKLVQLLVVYQNYFI